MPDRLPRELRVLHELAQVVGTGPYGRDDVIALMTSAVQREFGFAAVRVLGDDAARSDHVLLDTALAERRAVVQGDRVAAPLLADGRCLGYLLADRGGAALGLGQADLHLLTALGVVGGVFIAKAEQYEELCSALDELRRAHELKDEFVSIASHELRTPIAVVYGIGSTLHLRADDLRPEQAAQLRQTLFEQTVRLRDLAEQLLDLSRFDAGRLRLDPAPFHPREVVAALVPRLAPERVDEVRVEIAPEEEVVADAQAFERVVGNLVGNALKYGRPPVVVRGCHEHGRFRLEVEDCGPGVPHEFVPRLFERFTRADAAPRTADGAGLGLAIALEFAEALGAELAYEDAEPSGGARFVLALPRD